MKNALYSFEKRKFFIEEMLIPRLKPEEVLVRIKVSALCGTDLHIMESELMDKVYDKKEIILGHEWAGVIKTVGEKVTKFKKGDRVFGSPHISCGQCDSCLNGHSNWCDKQGIFGLSLPGSHAEYLVAPQTVLFHLPSDMDFREGALLGDTISIAYHAIKKVGPEMKRALILGTGPIGLTIGYFLKIFGIKEIFIIEKESYRRRLAQELFDAKIIEIDNFSNFRRTCDCAFETSGSLQLMEYAFHSLKRGGRMALLSINAKKYPLDTLRLMYREISILGCFGYSHEEVPEFIKLISNKKAKSDIEKIITHHFALADIGKAYKLFKNKKCGKVILTVA
jgi:2-desacetyl-2-hydroxyethyl bacteriochlorophyllide A dehydrogenase